MPNENVTVYWELASDNSFSPSSIVRSGQYTAKPDFAHSVHVDAGLEGTGSPLTAYTTYYYRFGVDKKSDNPVTYAYTSPTGRTKTAPSSGWLPAQSTPMKLAFASCQHWESGYYPAYRHLAGQKDLDLVVHLGDYIYEGAPSKGNILRTKPGGSGYDYHSAVADPSWGCNTLTDYRNRHAQYKTDPDLQAAHATHPWVVTWDDHEVENDYAGTKSWYRQSDFAQRRAAAYQAYYEHMPLRSSSIKLGTDGKVQNIDLYRQIPYGNLAQFLVLDTRQFRTEQPCGDQGSLIEPSCKERSQDPILRNNKPYRRHTILSAEGSATATNPWLMDKQESWLQGKLTSSGPTWNVLAQQVPMFQYDHRDWTGNFYSESWDSYVAARNRILKHIVDKGVGNPVVLTGDMHSSWAANLETNFNDTSHTDVIGCEFVSTSISSGLGSGWDSTYKKALPYNKHVTYYDGRNGGYVLCKVNPEYWQSDYYLAGSLSSGGASVSRVASWYVQAGNVRSGTRAGIPLG